MQKKHTAPHSTPQPHPGHTGAPQRYHLKNWNVSGAGKSRPPPQKRGHLAAKQEKTTKIGMFPTVPSERGQPLLVDCGNTGAEQFTNILM